MEQFDIELRTTLVKLVKKGNAIACFSPSDDGELRFVHIEHSTDRQVKLALTPDELRQYWNIEK